MNATVATAVASPKPGALREAFLDWTRTELPKWLFVLRTITAAMTALFIAYRLEFSSPSTSMVTVFIVSVPQSGQVLAKSFYRILGTLAGAFVAVLLVGSFVQQRDLFLVLLAAWLGICTTGAAYFRGFKAYAFVLAGYGASIIAIPTVMMPLKIFDTAMYRVSEVTLGILCAGVFAELVFSQRTADLLIRAVRTGYSGYVEYLQKAFDGRLDRVQLEDTHLGFINETIQFEALRESGYFENPEVRVRSARLRLFNAEFMNASTAFYGYEEMLDRLRRRGDGATAEEYRAIGQTMLEALQIDGHPPKTAAEGRLALRRLKVFRQELEPRLAEAHARLRAQVMEPEAQAEMSIVFDTVARQYDRFVDELIRYTEAYASLDQLRSHLPHLAPPFSPHTDTVGAMRMGVRAFLTVLIVSVYWVSTGWTGGGGAVLISGVVCALFAAAPFPEVAAKKLLTGFVYGIPVAVFVQFGIMPHLDGFPLLVAGLVPVMMITTYFAATPSTSAVGLGMNLQMLTSLNLNNVTVFDLVALFNGSLGAVFGAAVGVIMLTVVIPTQPRWFARRMRRSLRRAAARACRAPLSGLRASFESRTRDLLVQLVTHADRSHDEHHEQLGQALAVLDLGDAVIHLRRAARDAGDAWPQGSLRHVLASLETLLLNPTPEFRERARVAINAGLDELRSLGATRSEPEFSLAGDGHPLWRLHTDLVRIRGILKDDVWFTDMARRIGEPVPVATTADGAPNGAA